MELVFRQAHPLAEALLEGLCCDLRDQSQVFSGPELVGQNEFHVGLALPDDTRREGPQMAPGKAKPLVPASPAG